MEVYALQHVDHGRHQALGQREGAIMLGVAADLQHPLAELGEGSRQVRRGRALADAALAIDEKTLAVPIGRASRCHMMLDAAVAIFARGLRAWASVAVYHGRHAAASALTSSEPDLQDPPDPMQCCEAICTHQATRISRRWLQANVDDFHRRLRR